MAKTAFAADQLRSIIERIERMNKEIAAAREDLKEIYAEAKGVGFDPATIRRLVARRKKDPKKLEEKKALDEVYAASLGWDLV